MTVDDASVASLSCKPCRPTMTDAQRISLEHRQPRCTVFSELTKILSLSLSHAVGPDCSSNRLLIRVSRAVHHYKSSCFDHSNYGITQLMRQA